LSQPQALRRIPVKFAVAHVGEKVAGSL
jgi:hypothetical protein